LHLAVVCARAFITAQHAAAHVKLLEIIFNIAQDDTGLYPQFRYMHGEGYETITADAHKGEALGKHF